MNPSETTGDPTSRRWDRAAPGSAGAAISPEHRALLADIAVAIVLTVAAYLVRRSGVGPSSLWLDDAWVALVYRVNEFADVWRMGLTAPGFAVVLKVWLDGVGLSSTAAQAIPLVAGTLTPASVYLVARRLGLRHVAALIAGLLLVVAPTHATYSVRVKQYAVDGLLVVWLLWLGIRASEHPSGSTRWRSLGLAAGLATVVSTTVVPAAAAITVGALVPGLVERVRGRKVDLAALGRWEPVRWVGGYLLFAVLWGLWMVGARLSERLHEYWEGFYLEGWADLPRIATTLVEGLTGEGHGLVVLLVTALFLVGAVWAVRQEPRTAAMLWGPVGAAFVLAATRTSPLGTGRTELYLYPVLALALAWTVDHLGRRTRDRVPADAIGVVTLVALIAVALPLIKVTYPQQDLRPLVELAQQELEPTDQVLVSPGGAYAMALYGPWMTGIRRNDAPLGFAPRFTERVTVIRLSGETAHIEDKYGDLPAGTRVWLLASHDVEERVEGGRTALRELGFDLTAEASRPGAVLELWVREGGSAGGVDDRPDREQRLSEGRTPAILHAS